MPNKATSTGLPRADIQGSLMELPTPQRFIALDIFSPFPTQKKKGSYGLIPREAMAKRQDVKRSPKTGYNRGDWKFEDASYKCQNYGHEELADDDERAEYGDLFDYEVVLAARGRNTLLIEQEIRAKDLLHNTTTFPQSGNTGLAVAKEWDDYTFARPIDDVQAAREGVRARSGLMVNAIQISWQGWYDLWRCDQIRERFSNVVVLDTPGPENAAARTALAGHLGLKYVHVGDQFYDSAADGQATVVTDIWSQEYATVFYQDPSVGDIQRPTMGRCFHYDAAGGLYYTFQYREEGVESDVYRVKQCVDERIVVAEACFLLSNCYTP